MNGRPKDRSGGGRRWWPAVAILGVSALLHLWIWFGPEPTGQYRTIRTFIAVFLTACLLFVWFTAFSGFARRTKWIGVGVLGGLGLLLASTVEIRGVTGNLRPLLAWRWSPDDGRLPPAEMTPAVESDTPVAGEFPQFLGPNRDATLHGVWLDPDWEAHPPRERWRRPIGAGWASFAVAGGLAITLEQRGENEWVTAYELTSGEPVWGHSDPVRYATTIGGIGPRSTPTIARGRVYAMGATGLLNALDLATGALFWSHDVVAEHGGWNPDWGKSCSPLVSGDLVVVCAGAGSGETLVAYDAATGLQVWAAGDDVAGYSSPVFATLGGVRQIVLVSGGVVAGHDPETGRVLWRYEWDRGQPNVATPLVLPGDLLMVSKGYGVGSELFSVRRTAAGFATEKLWRSPRLKLKFSHAVLHGGKIYGLDDGVLVCLDPETGERCWKAGRYGHGQLLLVEDLLLIQAEDGEVALVEPSPERLLELARFRPLSSKTWNIPTLAGRYLLVRNDREAALYELPLRRVGEGADNSDRVSP